MLGIFKKHSYQGTYTGDVRNDMAHGFGKLEFKDGSNYEGGFLFDEFHGGEKSLFLMMASLKVNGRTDTFMRALECLKMETNMRASF